MVEVKEIELKGHIIDSLILPKVFDIIMDLRGDFEVLEFNIGKKKTDYSFARMLVKGRDREHLDRILGELHKLGAGVPEIEEVELIPALADKVLPDNFYSTTHHPTYVRVGKKLIPVENIEMDGVIVVDKQQNKAFCKKIGKIKQGELIVVGSKGVRVEPPERPRRGVGVFEFMGSRISTEKPSKSLVKHIAKEIIIVKKKGGKIAVVAGPAVIHTGAASHLAEMIKEGMVDALLAGNALAVHDVEQSLFGTSLGMNIETGLLAEAGHRHHIRAINEIMKTGSIKAAVEKGILKSGIMYECIKKNIPFVLAGSIRDDGPLPDVITDVTLAQEKMREALRNTQIVIMLASILHGVATGNMLSSTVKTIFVDINPASVTKLMDRGTAQALGIVTDVGVFLPMLVEELRKLK